MTDRRAICGTLVNMKNVGVHKSVALTIHVPQEQALHVTELFGWPTMVDPVPVALARLNQQKGGDANEIQPHNTVALAPGQQPQSDRARKSWEEMSAAQQAGILCTDPAFRKFIAGVKYGYPQHPLSEEDAAYFVRCHCGVASRSHIRDDSAAWRALVTGYRAWKREPDVVG
jgi:hypothetical protein